MSLYHKYRPTGFSNFVGNTNTVVALDAELRKDDPSHVYLFHGPTGCGKTTLARIVAYNLGCRDSDLQEIDAADFRGIDTVRDIRKRVAFKPLCSDARVWILDECHNLVSLAQTALLKLLEEAPPHAYFVLCTTDPQKLLPTIRGRCQQYQVAPLEEDNMCSFLADIAGRETKEELDNELAEAIARESEGRPRNALQILEQVLSLSPKKRMEAVKQFAEVQSQTIELCRHLLSKGCNWRGTSKIVSGLRKEDPEKVRRAVLGYCSSVLLKGRNDRAAVIIECMERPFYDSGFAGLVFACYEIVCGE